MGGGFSTSRFWDRKMPKNEDCWSPQNSKIEAKMTPKKGIKKNKKKITFFLTFFNENLWFSVLVFHWKWRFRSRGSSILTLSKFYLKSSVWTIASWFGGWKIIKFRPKNGVKSSKNRSQKKKLVAKRLRKAFWTEKCAGTPPSPPWAGLLEEGGGMDKSIPEGWYL